MEFHICPKDGCKFSGELQPITNFPKRKNSKIGYFLNECLSCKRERSKISYSNNIDKERERSRNRAKLEIDKRKEISRKHYENNKDELLQKSKIRYENNKEKSLETNYSWRTSLASKNYLIKLENYEECRIDPSNNELIQCKCTYCGKWFNPTNENIKSRLKYINGSDHRENRIYCSDNCKKSCPIFYQKLFPKNFDIGTSREVQPELRRLVLKRDNYKCSKCFSDDKPLHCHHIDPVINNPIESADIDNCVTLCIDCHKEAHQKDGCKINQLHCNNI